ncbi:MAG: DinB family protein [Candidatus Cyclobacteriaceae bacterium M3_2C_046]
MLYHIINHSTYHRAQIALISRQQLVIPPNSDYIFFKRG